MGATAGMVKSVVVKGAGGGAGKRMSCEAICAQFDPPIKFGSHAELVGSLDGFQAEHIVPTSAFHKSGRGGKKVKGCEGYSTSGATTWMVRDGQKAGQEHKRLTDPMRQFSQMKDLAGEEAPLKDWLKEYEKGAKDALKKAKPQRKIKNKKLDRNSLIDAAAKCIRSAAAESFDKMDPKVSQDTMLRNPWKATKEQKAEAAAAVQQVSRKRKR